MHSWRTEQRRKNRFTARFLPENAFDEAAEADGDISENDDDEAADQDNADEGAEDENEEGVPIGQAVDGVDDGVMETVLLVQARNRSPQRLTRNGTFDAVGVWYEIVPKSRVVTVLKAVFNASGTLFTTAATLYNRLAESYIGISHNDVITFLSEAETAVLSRSNAAADAIIAPSMPTRLGQRWAADITFSDGTLALVPYVGFMTVIDALSRFAWLEPIVDKSAATVAGMLETLFEAEGPPEVLLMDNALEHKSASVRLVCQRHGVQLRFTRPYKSEENGQVEVCHKTIKQLLRKIFLDTQAGAQAVDAAAILASAARMYNASPNSVTGMSPFLLWKGRAPARLQAPILLAADSSGAGVAAAVARGKSKQGRRASFVGSVSTGRGAGGVRRELREILADQSTREEQERQAARLRRQNTAAAATATAARHTVSVTSKQSRELWKTSPAAAVMSRLGMTGSQQSDRAAALTMSQQRAAAASSSSSSSSSSQIPAASLTGTGEWKIGRVLAVVQDAVSNQLLYGIRWAPPYDDVARDVFVPAAWIGGATDAKMAAFIRRTQKDALPIVFSRQFRGPPSLDRKRAIPFNIVLNDVEADNDGEGPSQPIGNAMPNTDIAGEERVQALPSAAASAASLRPLPWSQPGNGGSSSAAATQQNSRRLSPQPPMSLPYYGTVPIYTPQQMQQQMYIQQMLQLQQLQQQRQLQPQFGAAQAQGIAQAQLPWLQLGTPPLAQPPRR